MDREYRRLRRIVLAARRLEAGERAAFLDRECGGDGRLRREAEGLLAHDAAFGDLAPFQPPSPPERLGRYLIERELGRGGMGIVYLAEDPVLHRKVALKILPSDRPEETALLERFRREARLLAALTHPNIAVIHSLEEEGEVHFITMEWVPGPTLAERLAEGPMARDEALRLAHQTARALEAAHARGIVHRDLKPPNLKLTPDGEVKLLDFGIAKSLGPAAEDLTQLGAFAGTPGYASPEQLRADAPDHRSDIWSFGCILFECLAGAPAFEGRTPLDRIAASLMREPAWQRLPAGTPPEVRALLERCLAKDPAARLGGIAEARALLEAALAAPEREGTAPADAAAPPPAVGDDLPLALTAFVGREEELAALERHLDGHRLVTLTGPGGCGKTRLAVEFARGRRERFPDGVRLVELAAVTEPAAVAESVASVFGVREEGGTPLARSLANFLRERGDLLLLDNCEHLRHACARLVETLLRQAPRLRVLATSREPLGLTGEVTLRVPSLDVPAGADRLAPETLLESAAVRLFVDRVRSALPDFSLDAGNAAHVLKICRRLDGIPLALELAAARARAMSVEEIARHLDDTFGLLAGGSATSLPQHRTLEALIGWSHVLLDEPERALFRRLAVFSGGCTLDAAEAVAAGEDPAGPGALPPGGVLDPLARLVDKSLVEVETARARGRSRYRMLETVRSYARARLDEAGETRQLERRLLLYLAELAERAEPGLSGPDQSEWLGRLAAEHADMRAALEACARGGHDLQAGLRLAGALKRYWSARGHWSEARRLLGALLDRPDAGERTAARAEALDTAGWLAQRQGDHQEARLRHEECLAIREELGDAEGVAHSLGNLGNLAENVGEFARARELHERSLASKRGLGDLRGIAASLNNLGNLAARAGDYPRARVLYEESLAIKRSRGDQGGISASLNNLGRIAAAEGRYDEARERLEEALRIRRELGEKHGIADTLVNLGIAEQARGEIPAARRFLLEAVSLHHELDNRAGHAEALEAWAGLAARQGQARGAVNLLAAADALREEVSASLSETERLERERLLASLRAALGEPVFAREWARGRALSRDESAAIATTMGLS